MSRPRTTKLYNGKPCKTCGNTLRYMSTQNCVDCQRKRVPDDVALWRPLGIMYGVQPEFTRWVTMAPVVSELHNG